MSGLVPLRQGDLDGLCGVYACLNAIQLLVPAARDWDYLNKLMVHIIGVCYTAKDVTAGGDELKMCSVFKYASGKVLKDHKADLSMTNVARPDGFKNPDDFIEAEFALGHPGVFVMGYEGRDSHWIVVRDITDSRVMLFDSCGQKFFDRKDLIWSKKKNPAKSNKIIVSPGDLNWISCGVINA